MKLTRLTSADRALPTITLVSWCRRHNVGIRFESNGTVSAWGNGKRRRRATFREVVVALSIAFGDRVRRLRPCVSASRPPQCDGAAALGPEGCTCT